MRFVLLLLLFSCIIWQTNCRPSKSDDRAELNQENESGDQYSDLDGQEGQEDEAAANDNTAQQDNDETPSDNEQNYSENEVQSAPKLEDAKYHENHDRSDQGNTQFSYNHAADEYKQNTQLKTAASNRVVKKRSREDGVDFKTNDGDLLFENYLRSQQKTNSKIFNNPDENQDVTEQPRYLKRYYVTGNRKQQSGYCKAAGSALNRNRREAQNTVSDDSSLESKLENDEISIEDETSAIKRHVKKLTSEELEQLLNSLPDDKKGLLKKIIDSNPESNNLIKREITKKALELNNIAESGHTRSESPSAVNADLVVSQNMDTEKSNENVSGIVSPSDVQVQSISVGNEEKSMSPVTGSCSTVRDVDTAAVTKSASKREVHNEDFNAKEDETADKTYYNERDSDEGYLVEQEDDSSEVENDDAVDRAEAIPRKRETSYQKYSELTDSERSLEESFPNSKAYEDSDPYAASDMLPLVRVKRKNSESVPVIIKKRAAAVMPDSRVAFVPYRAENDDEDNNEASEFDDNGFYDRSSDLKVDDKRSNVDGGSPDQEVEGSNDNMDGHDYSNLNENLKYNKANIGSDTDGVLSGVEGVDENLMLSKQNSELIDQNRDAVELKDDTEVDAGQQTRKKRSATEAEPQNDIGKAANAPIYHEIDAFGPLPEERDVETSRFKRIRRVKQLPESGEIQQQNSST